MFVHALAGVSLLISVSINPGAFSPENDLTPISLPPREKTAILHPLIDMATDCVVRTVAADQRLGKLELNSLIVEAFESCAEPMRTMIDAHDRYYGSGSGQQFFMGPYLDALPGAVNAAVGSNSH
jgi:hypothetical protein